MACCTGQDNCNKIVTIGYLNSFIGSNIKDSNGNTKTASGSDDRCPTYAELTNGSLVPKFHDGGSGNWQNNVDGITVTGSYSSSQCVQQKDLVLTYTRFESFSISAGKTTFDACEDLTSLGYDFKLKKTVKTMNGNCSTTESPSTGNGDSVTFTSSASWLEIKNNNTASAKKNGTRQSPARTATVSGTTKFQGQTYTRTLNITQEALTGSWVTTRADSIVDSYDSVTITPNSFDAEGGYWNAYGCYTIRHYEMRKWVDSCGEPYDETETGVAAEPEYTHHVELAGTGQVTRKDRHDYSSDYSNSGSVNYHDKVAYWTQSFSPLNQNTGSCECGEDCEHVELESISSIPCGGGESDRYENYTAYTLSCNTETGEEEEIINNTGRRLVGTAKAACNPSGSYRYAGDAYQYAGPCCPAPPTTCQSTSEIYLYYPVTVSCISGRNETAQADWVHYRLDNGVTTAIDSGRRSVSIPNRDYNKTSSEKKLQTGITGTTLANAKPKIVQAAGPCCPTSITYIYDDVIVPCVSAESQTVSATYHVKTVASNCASGDTVLTTNVTVPAVDYNRTASVNTIQQGHSGTTLETALPTIKQAAGPCCPTSVTFVYDDIVISCSGADATTVSAPYHEIRVGENCAKSDNGGTTSISVPGMACNPTRNDIIIQQGASGTTLAEARPTIKQAAGPCCKPSDMYIFDVDVTIPCSGDTAKAKNYNVTHHHIGPDLVETITYESVTINVPSASCNATSEDIIFQTKVSSSAKTEAQPTIMQLAGPCCPTSDTYVYDNTTVPCIAEAATTKSVGYTLYHVNADKTTTTTTGTNPNTPIPEHSCNPNNTTRVIQSNASGSTLESAKPGVTQEAGPCCPCECSMLTVSPTSLTWEANQTSTNTKAINISAVECTKNITTNINSLTHFTASISNNVITVAPRGTNVGEEPYNETIYIYYNAVDVYGSNSCTSAVTLTQKAPTCQCSDFSIAPTSATWVYNSTSVSSITVSSGDCISNITLSGLSHFTATIGTNVITVSPRENNNTGVLIEETLTIGYKANGGSCTNKTVILRHNPQELPPCDCNYITFTKQS